MSAPVVAVPAVPCPTFRASHFVLSSHPARRRPSRPFTRARRSASALPCLAASGPAGQPPPDPCFSTRGRQPISQSISLYSSPIINQPVSQSASQPRTSTQSATQPLSQPLSHSPSAYILLSAYSSSVTFAPVWSGGRLGRAPRGGPAEPPSRMPLSCPRIEHCVMLS